MLNEYIKLENMGSQTAALQKNVREGIPGAVFGVSFAHKCHIAATLGLPVIYVARDAITARAAAAEIRAVSGEKAVFLPAKEDVLLYDKAISKDALYGRIGALFELSQGAKHVACTLESLIQLMPDKIDFFTLEKEKEYDLTEVVKKLVALGYKREESVEQKGEFSVRGDVLVIFAINLPLPVRVDFFGDEIEKIRVIGDDGVPERELKGINVLTCYDYYIEDGEIEEIKKRIEKDARSFGVNVYASRAKQIAAELCDKLDAKTPDRALSFIIPLLKCSQGSLKNYMPQNAVVIFDECKLCSDALNGDIKEHFERCTSLKRSGECFSFTPEQYKTEERLFGELSQFRKLALQTLNSPVTFFNPLFTLSLNCGVVPRYYLKPEEIFTDVRNWRGTGYRVLICCGTSERAERLSSEMDEREIFNDRVNVLGENFSGVKITDYYLTHGFIYHESKTVVIGTGDIYAKRPEKKMKRRRGNLYTAPVAGDYCVHEVHGIGVVRGTKRITTTDSTKDYVAIEYKDGALLYVCVDNMDCLTKYEGAEEKPQLSRIGGQEFERVKQRVKASIAKLSINLKKLYRERQTRKGFAFSPDDALSREFDEAFEYEPTEDQLQSIKEIKQDMESTKVMDRLLCGDVGFGKTEVAMRAAFKAVKDGKQVALVAPTTILAEQHYTTFKKRFDGFGVRIAAVDRFRTAAEQTKTLYDLSVGEVDIIIGTHRMFSKDVKFKDLGLLILDEEQRFGVEHKEKLKLLKENVDTLSMSATPIPRTLHMSLTGIRDVSTINTPPSNRIPVQTFVAELTDSLIKDAILKELSREGQTFVLFNRVEGIDAFALEIKNLVPEARVIAAHGQLPEKTLEERVAAFYKKEYDVLVATTIIENGVDIPDANTLIVADADRLGLSTLYQLKGRVGRSDRMARAYFTYASQKVLTDAAYKRLTALAEYSELGSGYRIAMRDLEIRGAGNVLGKEQHGHMDRIGYELYSKLLKQELSDVAETETELDVRITAYIPDEYLEAGRQRMECYKQIAEIRSDEDENSVRTAMHNAFGEFPLEVENLFAIARLKRLCSQMGIIKAEISEKGGRLIVKDLKTLSGGGLIQAVNQSGGTFKLDFSSCPAVVYAGAVGCGEDIVDEAVKLLENASKADGATAQVAQKTV